MGPSRTPLSPTEQAALDQLEEQLAVTVEPVPQAAAIDYLVTDRDVRGAAVDLIEQLRVKGALWS